MAGSVTGFDYDGAWGRGTFNYFQPTTGWRDARSRAGYEERALAGMELSLQTPAHLHAGRGDCADPLGITRRSRALGNRSAGGLFLATPCLGENQDRVGRHRHQDPEPHRPPPFLTFPLGSRKPIPGWQGLALGSLGQNIATMDIWRPIDNIGQIRVAERAATSLSVDEVLSGLTVRFLQDGASNGESVKVEVAISAPGE